MLPQGLRRRRDFAIPMRSYVPASQTNDRAMPSSSALATPNFGTPAFAFSNIHEVGMVCLGTTERRNRYRYPQILSVSDMPACLVHSHGRETTIRPFATEKLSDK